MIKIQRLTIVSKARYRIDDSSKLRRKALARSIILEQQKGKISLRKAAIAKKGRLNILRIYRRYKLPNECARITRDMKWIDKTYSIGGITKNICK